MKFGIRVPSLKKRIAALTSWKRYVRHNLGLKAPSGLGVITDPKKAVYNKIYNQTSVSVDKLTGSSKKSNFGILGLISLIFIGLLIAIFK